MLDTFGKRLRWLRELKGLTLREFADRVGADPGYLSKLESGKSKSPSMRFFVRLSMRFYVSTAWLSSGVGEAFENRGGEAKGQHSLSKSESERLNRIYAVLDELPDALAGKMVLGHLLRDKSLKELQTVWSEVRNLPGLPPTAVRFWNEVFTDSQFPKMRFSSSEGEIPKLPLDKDILDESGGAATIASMSLEFPTWSQLKKEIARLTSERGAKAALADKLGVSRQVLGNWLSDDDQGAPNAELTLRLLKWVRDPKRQTK